MDEQKSAFDNLSDITQSLLTDDDDDENSVETKSLREFAESVSKEIEECVPITYYPKLIDTDDDSDDAEFHMNLLTPEAQQAWDKQVLGDRFNYMEEELKTCYGCRVVPIETKEEGELIEEKATDINAEEVCQICHELLHLRGGLPFLAVVVVANLFIIIVTIKCGTLIQMSSVLTAGKIGRLYKFVFLLYVILCFFDLRFFCIEC